MLSSNGMKLKGEENPQSDQLEIIFFWFSLLKLKKNTIHFAVRKVLCFIRNVLFQALAAERKKILEDIRGWIHHSCCHSLLIP